MQFFNPAEETVHYADGTKRDGQWVVVTLKRRLPNKKDAAVWKFALPPQQNLLDPGRGSITFGGSLGSLVVHSTGEVRIY